MLNRLSKLRKTTAALYEQAKKGLVPDTKETQKQVDLLERESTDLLRRATNEANKGIAKATELSARMSTALSGTSRQTTLSDEAEIDALLLKTRIPSVPKSDPAAGVQHEADLQRLAALKGEAQANKTTAFPAGLRRRLATQNQGIVPISARAAIAQPTRPTGARRQEPERAAATSNKPGSNSGRHTFFSLRINPDSITKDTKATIRENGEKIKEMGEEAKKLLLTIKKLREESPIANSRKIDAMMKRAFFLRDQIKELNAKNVSLLEDNAKLRLLEQAPTPPSSSPALN